MSTRLLSAFGLSFFLLFQSVFFAHSSAAFSLSGADEEEVELTDEEPAFTLRAPGDIGVNQSIIFDVDFVDESLDADSYAYEWFLGDGNRQQGKEVVHSYADPGFYSVELLLRDADQNETRLAHEVFVYERSFVLVTNVYDEQERVRRIVDTARNEYVFVKLIEAYSAQSEFLEEEALKAEMLEELSSLQSSDLIVVWTKGSSGLTVLPQFLQSITNKSFFRGKEIVFVSDADFGSLLNIARGVYKSISPSQIVMARSETLWLLTSVESVSEFLETMDERGDPYELVNDEPNLKPWNFMSHFVNGMIEAGVPSNTIRLILMLPLIVTMVAFMKQVVGLSTLGVYTPSILTLSFIALDLWYGILILFAILLIGTLVRIFLRRYRLLYIPRMSILLTIASLTILLLLFVGSRFDIASVSGVAVFPMLIMTTMVEKFVSIQSGKGLRRALTVVGEAILVAVLCYYVAEWDWLKVVILGHPELIFGFLLVNVFLGRWTGLRLMEYVRFREIIRHAEE